MELEDKNFYIDLLVFKVFEFKDFKKCLKKNFIEFSCD